MVADLGSLYKYAGFRCEGAFHVFQKYFHGTINICNQIVSKLNFLIENDKFLTQEEITKIRKPVFERIERKFSLNKIVPQRLVGQLYLRMHHLNIWRIWTFSKETFLLRKILSITDPRRHQMKSI
jgi:hypothetical protein